MRAVLQRVSRAVCLVEGNVAGSIESGLLVFLGVEEGDTETDLHWIAGKVVGIRVFPDDGGRMNRSLYDTGGGVLLISQFTLHGNLAKGTRPSFNRAASPEIAKKLYGSMAKRIAELLERPTACGVFGAHMDIEAHNDGPVTILIDSRNKSL